MIKSQRVTTISIDTSLTDHDRSCTGSIAKYTYSMNKATAKLISGFLDDIPENIKPVIATRVINADSIKIHLTSKRCIPKKMLKSIENGIKDAESCSYNETKEDFDIEYLKKIRDRFCYSIIQI